MQIFFGFALVEMENDVLSVVLLGILPAQDDSKSRFLVELLMR